MKWEIQPGQGFGVLGALTVFIDLAPLPSGAVRCVGPFSTEGVSLSAVRTAMRALTIQIEDDYLDPDQFVLWGSYMDRAEFQEHEIEISGTTCGYVPAAWMRSQLLSGDDDRLSREWTRTSDGVVHRSGLSLPNIGSSIVDSAMFHPKSAEMAVAEFFEAWSHVLGLRTSSLELPIFRWTPVRVLERAGVTS